MIVKITFFNIWTAIVSNKVINCYDVKICSRKWERSDLTAPICDDSSLRHVNMYSICQALLSDTDSNPSPEVKRKRKKDLLCVIFFKISLVQGPKRKKKKKVDSGWMDTAFSWLFLPHCCYKNEKLTTLKLYYIKKLTTTGQFLCPDLFHKHLLCY